MEEHDELSHVICSSCRCNLTSLVQFKQICIQSDEKARNRLNIKSEEILLDDLVWKDHSDLQVCTFPNDDKDCKIRWRNCNAEKKRQNINVLSSKEGSESTVMHITILPLDQLHMYNTYIET